MPSIPAERLSALRNNVPVLAVVSELQIPTKMRGRRRTFRCPKCGSFQTAANARTNLTRCFRCRVNFNPIDLVVAERRVSFLEAVRFLESLVERGLRL